MTLYTYQIGFVVDIPPSSREISRAKKFTEHFRMGKVTIPLNIVAVYPNQLWFMNRRVINIFGHYKDLPFSLDVYNNVDRTVCMWGTPPWCISACVLMVWHYGSASSGDNPLYVVFVFHCQREFRPCHAVNWKQ